jgi:hypothetical protein
MGRGRGGRGGGSGGQPSSSSDSKRYERQNFWLAASKQRTEAIKATRSPQQLLLLVHQHAANFTHVNLSAAYTHAARLCQQGVPQQQQPAAVQQLLSELHHLAVQLQQQCVARQLANITWSCGKLCCPDTAKLLLPLFLRASTLQQAEPQNVSNVLWAAATLQLQPTGAELQQLLWRFTAVLADATPQEVSNTLWAVATMGQQVPPQQLQRLLEKAVAVLADATPQAVSNTLWAVATMGRQVPPQQLQKLLGRFVAVLPDATPQAVSNTLWAAATMGRHLPPQQLQQAVAAFVELLPAATSQAVANLVWACARMQYMPLQLFRSLQQHPQQLKKVLAGSTPQALANMAWACGELGYRGKLLPGVLLQQAVNMLQGGGSGSFTLQHMCNLCWTAAVLDLQQDVPQVLQLAAAASHVLGTGSAENMLQLHQVHLWLLDGQLPAPSQGLSVVPGQGLLGVLTQQQLEQCKISWEQLLAETAKQPASHLQESVFSAFQQLPPDTWQQLPQSEQPTADKACLIDIAAVVPSGVRVAIEVDGPTHFVWPERSLGGATQARNRALAARGYAVISIPYWEWERLRSAGQRQQYLLAKLHAVQH